jgi:hypothetical protein
MSAAVYRAAKSSTKLLVTEALAFLPVDREPTEIVMGTLAFAEVFGAGADRKGACFLDVPVRVDIQLINPHGFYIVSRERTLTSGFLRATKRLEYALLLLFAVAAGVVAYVVFLAVLGGIS